MKIKNKIISIVMIFLLGISFIITPLSNAQKIPCSVRGYVYIDGEITEPEELDLIFPTQTITCSIFNDGYYIADFSENTGETGYFICTYEGNEYEAEETVTIENNVYIYRLNLTIITSSNNAPKKPINPIPEDGQENVSINPELSIFVDDTDDDYLDVRFYNASNDLIGQINNVQTDTRPSINLINLDYNTSYNWYVIVEDSEGKTNISEIFSFRTIKQGTNQPPNKPIYPTPMNNSENVILAPELKIYVSDPDLDKLTVKFFNATDDSLIGIKSNIDSNTYTTIIWNNLAYNKTYSWYVKVNDSEYLNTSDVFNFKTIKKDDAEPFVNITFPKIGGLYYKNKIYLKGLLKDPIIIGNITINANASDDNGIDRVEFYIYSFKNPKGLLVKNDTDKPYTYDWGKEKIRLMHLYIIRAKAYDNTGKNSYDELIVRKFF